MSKLSLENFLSQGAKNFVGEPFGVSLTSSFVKAYASEGYVTIFRLKFIDS